MADMKKTRRNHFSFVLTMTLICLITATMIIPAAAATSAVDLGTAEDFVIYRKQALTPSQRLQLLEIWV